jgi:hypothetical protein
MLAKIFEKIVLDVVGKAVTFIWEKIFQNKSKPVDSAWDDNVGDYVAGVEKTEPTVKSDVDVGKWYKAG